MKKRELLVVSIVGFVLLVAAGSFSVTANPTQTLPCGNCHSSTGVLILTSNATGTVDATVGVPFALMLNQTGYSGGDGRVAVAIKSGWSDNDQFSFTEFGVEDGTGSDLNPSSDQVTVLVSLTPLAAGSWTIRAWTAGASGMVGTSLDISVSVAAASTTTTTTTTTTSTSTPPTQPGDSSLMWLTLAGVGAVIFIIAIVYVVRRS
ncbi:MAG: hypothetical protein ACFFCP_06110 [Promethearchaeota archaeon]